MDLYRSKCDSTENNTGLPVRESSKLKRYFKAMYTCLYICRRARLKRAAPSGLSVEESGRASM
jgi:hypothetical protein